MGSCSSKNKNRENTPLSIDSIFNTKKQSHSARALHPSQKSDFYFLTEWILSFRFYIKLYNDDQHTRLITMLNGPNDKNIFKVIKAIDQLDGKDLSEFSSSISLKSKNDSSKQSKQSFNTIPEVSPQLNDEELKLIVVGLFEKLSKDKPKKMKKLLFQGPPNNLRWIMWVSVARARYIEIESNVGINNEQIFNYLVNSVFPDNETEIKINNDLARTKPDLRYFRGGNGSISLFKVLKAIALYDDKLGYRIGMNEIAANALIVSDFNEVESFNLLRFLYSSEYGLQLREFYINGFPKLKFYTFLVYELIKERIPNVFKVLNEQNIVNEMWLQNWLQNLYSNLFEFSVGVRLWDCLISLGTEFLINFSLGYIKYFEEQIKACNNASEFLEIFKEKKKFRNNKEIAEFREKVIKLSLEFNISVQTYQRLQTKYNARVDTEQRTSIMSKPVSGFRNSITRRQINLLHIDKEVSSTDNNDEANKMKRIRNNINLPDDQRKSIFENDGKEDDESNVKYEHIEDNKEENESNNSNNNNNNEQKEVHDTSNENPIQEDENENIEQHNENQISFAKGESVDNIIKDINGTEKNEEDQIESIKNGNKSIIVNNNVQKNELNEQSKEENDSSNDDNIINNDENDNDNDDSIIDNCSDDEVSINKSFNNNNIDPKIIIKLSQLNMNVKEEQCPKGISFLNQNI